MIQKKTSNSKKITGYFKPVSEQVYKLNQLIEQQRMQVQLEQQNIDATAESNRRSEIRKQNALADKARHKRCDQQEHMSNF